MPVNMQTTSWVWPHDNGVQGVTIDLDKGCLHWYDNPGCACDDASQEQPIEDFLENGPLYGRPPADVVEEMRAALKAIAG